MSDEHIINEGTQEYGNQEHLVVNSYTFGEPMELTIEKLSRKLAILETRLNAVVCPDCPGPGAGCCKDADCC